MLEKMMVAMVVRVKEDCLVVDKMMPARLVKSTAASTVAQGCLRAKRTQ